MSTTKTTVTLDELLADIGWVRTLALQLARDAQSADDLVQEICLQILQAGEDCRKAPRRRAWVAVRLRSLARQFARAQRRRSLREERESRREATPSTVETVEAASVRRTIAEAIMRLPAPYRETLLFRYFAELTTAEIAARTSIGEDTVRQRLVRGRAKLREILDERAGGDGQSWLYALLPLFPTRHSSLIDVLPLALFLSLCLGIGLTLWRNDIPNTGEKHRQENDRYAYQEPSEDPVLDGNGRPLWLPPRVRASAPSNSTKRASLMMGLLSGDDHDDRQSDEDRLNADLAIRVLSAAPLSIQLADEQLEEIATRAGVDVEMPRQTQAWRCQAIHDKAETSCDILSVPLSAPLESARVVVALRDGEVLTLSAWGTPDLDEDPFQRWGQYLSQFIGHMTRWEDPRPVRNSDDLMPLFEEGDTRLIQALSFQHRSMRGHRIFGVVQDALARLDRDLEASWLTRFEEEFYTLAEWSSEFEAILGEEGVEEHSEYAFEAAVHFGEMREALESSDKVAVKDAKKNLRNTCNTCHRTRTSQGTPWNNAFAPLRTKLALPKPFVVGFDISPAVGDSQNQVSEAIASAVRMAVHLATRD